MRIGGGEIKSLRKLGRMRGINQISENPQYISSPLKSRLSVDLWTKNF